MGPVTFLEIEFPGNQFKGEIIPALRELVDAGTIRIIDLVLVRKNADGKIEPVEINELDQLEGAAFAGLRAEISGLLSYGDIEALGGALENNSSAGILLFENLWATRFTDTIANANGRWVRMESVPPQILEEAIAAQGSV